MDRYGRTKRINSVRKLRGDTQYRRSKGREERVEQRGREGTQGRTDVRLSGGRRSSRVCPIGIYIHVGLRSKDRTNGLGTNLGRGMFC